MGRRPAAGRDLAGRPPRSRALRRRVLRKRAHRGGVSAGRGAGAPAGGRAGPSPANVRAGAGQRPARRHPDGPHGLGGDPAGPRGRQRLRRVAGRPALMVSLPPPADRPAAAGAPPDLPGDRRLAAPRRGDVVRGERTTRSRRSGTPSPPATGSTPPACWPTTTSTSSSTAARRRCAPCWPPFRRARPKRTPSWRSRSPPLACTTACWRRAGCTSPWRSGGPRRYPTRGGGCSTFGSPARGSGSRVSVATSPPRERRRGRSTRGRKASSGAATTIAPRPSCTSASPSCGRCTWTTPAATSRRRLRSRAASAGRTWRSAASATSRWSPFWEAHRTSGCG